MMQAQTSTDDNQVVGHTQNMFEVLDELDKICAGMPRILRQKQPRKAIPKASDQRSQRARGGTPLYHHHNLIHGNPRGRTPPDSRFRSLSSMSFVTPSGLSPSPASQDAEGSKDDLWQHQQGAEDRVRYLNSAAALMSDLTGIVW